MKKILILIPIIFIFSNCRNEKTTPKSKPAKIIRHSKPKINKTEISKESNTENKLKDITVKNIFDKMTIKKTPFIDTTNFDNSENTKKFFDKEQIKELQLKEIYPNINKNGYNFKFSPSYKLNIYNHILTIVTIVFKGENEIEAVLINYDLNGKRIDNKVIAYDEIAEGAYRIESKIEKAKIYISNITFFDKKIEEKETYVITKNGYIKKVAN